jgi:hypothetical protein
MNSCPLNIIIDIIMLNDDCLSMIFEHLTDLKDVYTWAKSSVLLKKIYQQSNVWRLCALAKTKQGQLRVFLDYYRYLPKQGSDEWRKNRQAIGGSEIGTLMGINPYQKLRDLIANKAGLRSFSGNISTRWGNLFEDVLFGMLSNLLGTDLYETGSIPGLRDRNGRVLTHYSPDRLGCVKEVSLMSIMNQFNTEIDVVNEEILALGESSYITLFEGKCPLSRVPNDKIPEHYIMQPKVGACTIPIVEQMVFADAMYRKCAIEDIGFSKSYDTNFHADSDFEYVSTCGFIGFYSPTVGVECRYTEYDVKALIKHTELHMTVYLEKKHIKNRNMTEFPLEYMPGLVNMASLSLRTYPKIRISDKIYSIEQAIIKIFKHSHSKLHDAVCKMTKKLAKYFVVNAEIIYANYSDLIDYGKSNKNTMGELLHTVVEGRTKPLEEQTLCAYYPKKMLIHDSMEIPPISGHRSKVFLLKEVEKFRQFCRDRGYKPVGILPWKLGKLSLIKMTPEPAFLESIRPQILSATAQIDELKAAGDNTENVFSKMYPTRARKKIVPIADAKITPVWVDELPSSETPTFSADALDGFLDL